MAGLYKRMYKKYVNGGGVNPNAPYGNIAAGLDSLSPLTYKNLSNDFLANNEEARVRDENSKIIDQTQGKLENMAISSGNPYAMAAGTAIKGTRLLSNAVTKGTTDKFGVTRSTGAGVVKAMGDSINPIGMVGRGIDNLNNKDLNTAEKIGSFVPGVSTIVNNKVAKEQRKDYIDDLGKRNAESAADEYTKALASGFTQYGNENVEYKYGGKLYKKMAIGGDMVPMSSENMEVQGNSHEEGGVKLPEAGIELEGGETINEDFVFSKELGFADRHKKIAKTIGSIEGKPQNNITRSTLKRLEEREEGLKVEQEQLKEVLNIDDNGMKKYGGKLYKKMETGGYGTITSRGMGPANMYGGLSREDFLKGYGESQMPNFEIKDQVGMATTINKPMNKVAAPTTTVQENTTQGKSLVDGVNNVLGKAPNLTPYIDNITNFALNRQRAKEDVPQQEGTNYLNPVNYDYSAQKAEADRQRIGFNKGIDQNVTSSGVANTNKAVGLAQTIRAKNQIQEAETNANQAERARVSTINANIETSNKQINLNNKMRRLLAKDDIRREDSTNAANVAGDLIEASKDKKTEQLVKDQTSLGLSTQDPKTVAVLMKSNREVFKRQGWTDKQIDDFLENSKKSDNLDLSKSNKSLNSKIKNTNYNLNKNLGVKVG